MQFRFLACCLLFIVSSCFASLVAFAATDTSLFIFNNNPYFETNHVSTTFSNPIFPSLSNISKCEWKDTTPFKISNHFSLSTNCSLTFDGDGSMTTSQSPLKNGIVTITFKDNSTKDIPITINMSNTHIPPISSYYTYTSTLFLHNKDSVDIDSHNIPHLPDGNSGRARVIAKLTFPTTSSSTLQINWGTKWDGFVNGWRCGLVKWSITEATKLIYTYSLDKKPVVIMFFNNPVGDYACQNSDWLDWGYCSKNTIEMIGNLTIKTDPTTGQEYSDLTSAIQSDENYATYGSFSFWHDYWRNPLKANTEMQTIAPFETTSNLQECNKNDGSGVGWEDIPW